MIGDDIATLKDNGSVRCIEHRALPLTLWVVEPTADTRMMPMSFVTYNGEVVGRSWPRPLRLAQPGAKPRLQARKVNAYDKMDGVLVCATVFDDEVLLWTSDGFDGPVIEEAAAHLTGWSPSAGETVLFEALLKNHRRIVDYGDFDGMVLLGAVNHETLRDDEAPESVAVRTGWPGEIAIARTMPFEWFVSMAANPDNGAGREGIVVVWPEAEGSSVRTVIQFEWWQRARTGR